MSKFSIDWHETEVAAKEIYLKMLRKKIKELEHEAGTVEAQLNIYRTQITQAKRDGRWEFDRKHFSR